MNMKPNKMHMASLLCCVGAKISGGNWNQFAEIILSSLVSSQRVSYVQMLHHVAVAMMPALPLSSDAPRRATPNHATKYGVNDLAIAH